MVKVKFTSFQWIPILRGICPLIKESLLNYKLLITNKRFNLLQMQTKKFLLTVFIIFSLSFSFQPVNIYAKEKEAVVFILEYNQDKFTNDFIIKNEIRKFQILISLTLNCMLYSLENNYLNTS